MGAEYDGPYQPFYCEENAWWLCQASFLSDFETRVVFISNVARRCLLYYQRAAPPGRPVIWDYHVVVLARDKNWMVWDRDTRLGFPVDAGSYLRETFSDAMSRPEELEPRFRVIPMRCFLDAFSTDRSHMRDENGAWLQPPPPWDPPQAKRGDHNLYRFIDMESPFEGSVLDLSDMVDSYA